MATASIRTPETAAPPLTAAAKASAAREAAKKAKNGTVDAAAPATNVQTDRPSAVPEVAGARLWPHPPAGDEDFFDWASQFNSDDWNYILWYVWRTAPTIDRRANGRVTNIGKYSHYVDMERIKLDHGSGAYRIDMTVRDPTGGKTTRIAQHYFQIMDLDYPPRVPPGEWIEAPENEAWRWAKAGIAEQAAAANAPVDPNRVFDTVLAGVERLRGGAGAGDGAVMAAVLNSMTQMQQFMLAQADPAKQLAMLQTMVAAMVPQQRAGGGDEFTAFLREEMKAMRAELREFRNQTGKGIVEQLQELLPIAQLLGFKIPGAVGAKDGGATNWADVTDRVVDKLGDHLPLVIDAIRNRSAEPGGSGVAGFRIPGPARAAAAAETPAPEAAATPAAAAATVTDPPAEGEAVAEPITKEKQALYQSVLDTWGQLIQAVTPFMIDKFKQENGYAFRDWFIQRHGQVRWGALREQVGAQIFTELAQMHAFLKTALAPPEKFREFMDEFFTMPGEEPADVQVTEE